MSQFVLTSTRSLTPIQSYPSRLRGKAIPNVIEKPASYSFLDRQKRTPMCEYLPAYIHTHNAHPSAPLRRPCAFLLFAVRGGYRYRLYRERQGNMVLFRQELPLVSKCLRIVALSDVQVLPVSLDRAKPGKVHKKVIADSQSGRAPREGRGEGGTIDENHPTS